MNYIKTKRLAAATIMTLSISATSASEINSKQSTYKSIIKISKEEQELNNTKRKYTKRLKNIGASKEIIKNIKEAKTVREVKILSDKYLDSYYIF